MFVSAASDPARRPGFGLRALGRRQRYASVVRAAAWALVAAALLPAGAARAQSAGADGQIYIPGPGEAHAAPPEGMISIPGPGEAKAAQTRGNGMITIPGPGEAKAAQPSGMISIPGAGEAKAAARNGAGTNRLIPVVVTAPQRAVRTVQPGAAVQVTNVAFAPARGNAPAVAGAPMPSPAANPPLLPVAQGQTVAAPAAPAAPAASAQTAGAAPSASSAPAGQEDGETIRQAALAFLQQQTVGLPGKIGISVRPTFPRGLAACTTLEPFMPTGARLWGRTTVGVRCAGAKPWTLYLQAQISIEATYFLAARQIEPGSVVTAQDLLARNGDLSNLPRAVITDPSQAVGSTALSRISAGMPLRQDLLKSASAVTIGQTVRVVAQGQGFAISSEGSAMNNASPGQQVRVKMAGGQVISGIVKDGATVQVQM
jgi:flagellar basal body P-ring formation protein FlgA